MNGKYEDQHARMKRFLARIDPPSKDHGSQIEYEDNMWAFFQNAWHLKDWIGNDDTIVSFDIENEVKSYPSIQICADLANRSKHLKLRSPRVDAKHSKTSVTISLGSPTASYYEYVIEDSLGQQYKVIDLAKAIVKDWDDLIAKKVMHEGTGSRSTGSFSTVEVHTWDEIIRYKQLLEGKSWIFRGQPNITFPLECSLRRACRNFPPHISAPQNAEKLTFRDFKRRYHQYSNDLPESNDLLEWLSIMRHHGAPTRLIDFSYSLLIAAYFALEKSSRDCAIWAIKGRWASSESSKKFPKHSRERAFFSEPVSEWSKVLFKEIFYRKKPKRFACPVNPFRLTQRLTIQNGIFMCPGDISVSFETNLANMDGYANKDNLIRFHLSMNEENRVSALQELFKANITRATLFPGLDGFADSLGITPPELLSPSSIDMLRMS